MVLFEVKRRQPSFPSRLSGRAPQSPVERRRERLWMVSVYASSFLFILMVTAEFIYAKSVSALSPATEVTFAERPAQHSAGPGFRWRSAPFRSQRERYYGSLLALPETGRQSCHGIRCLPDLRAGRVLQGTERRGLQELRRPYQRTIGGHGRRVQSDSAACRTDVRCRHHPGDGHRRGRPHFPAPSLCSCACSTNRSGGRSGENCWPE